MQLDLKSTSDDGMNDIRTISDIIRDAGGAAAVAAATDGKVKKDAVYKWPSIGIPDRYWHVLADLAGATPDELYAANQTARHGLTLPNSEEAAA